MTTITKVEEALMAEVCQKQLMEYNQGVAKFIRNSGTEEELESFKYIEAELNKAGIATEMFFSDGYISLPEHAEIVMNGKSFECITHAMSICVDNMEAEVVYAGKGKPENYAGLEVNGKIVVIEGLCMPAPVMEAERRGVKGIVFLNDEHVHNMIGSHIWGSPSIENFHTLPKIAFLSVNAFAAEEIRAMLQAGKVEGVMTTVTDTQWRKLPTLVGTIPGNETPEKYLMLSNHVDGWVYGAMDNGSANAALMQVVKILKAHQGELKRTVKICFWSGHSHGRYAGSTWYCDANYEDLFENCFLHVNADSLGANGSDILTEAPGMAETKDLAAPIIAELANQTYSGCRITRCGDQSFWGTGTPSLFVGLSEQPVGESTAAKSFAELMGNGKTGGFGWWWHSSEDTIDKIDPVRLERDCKVYLLACYRALTDTYLPIRQDKAALDIQAIIDRYVAKTEGKCDLSVAVARAAELVAATAAIEAAKESLAPAVYNQYVMEMSQILVPLNFVEGSQYEHDAALRGEDVPVLTVLNKFQGVEVGSDEFKLIATVAIRRINAVNMALKQAVKLAKAVL